MSSKPEKLVDWLLEEWGREAPGLEVAENNHQLEIYQEARKTVIEQTIMEVRKLWPSAKKTTTR